MPWVRRRLRGAKVWVRCDGGGAPLSGPDGRADVLYQTGGKVYRASARNLEADDDPLVLSDEQAAPGTAAEPKIGRAPGKAGGRFGGGARAGTSAGSPHVSNGAPDGAVHLYTDGACTGNPGPMGIGVVLLDGDERRELSEYLGVGTNNIAELTAILRGLELAPRERPVLIYSDSTYAIGLLGQGWKAKANQELVGRLRALTKTFRDLRYVKVAAHAGVVENERCDELAREAILRR